MSEISVVEPSVHQTPEDQLSPSLEDESLPPEGRGKVPAWVWIVIAGVLTFSLVYLGRYVDDFGPYPWLHQPDLAAGQAGADDADVDGAQIYAFRCAACHQAEGTGVVGAFPPLVGSELVNGEPGVVTRIVMNGLSGPVVIGGVEYNGFMPAWDRRLSDAEIAAVVTYIRSSWSNQASAVTARQVAALRELLGGRNQPWTVPELQLPENQTLPPDDSAPADSTLAEM